MRNIAICDNDTAELEQLAEDVRAYAAARPDVAWQSFSDPALLLEALKDGAEYAAAVLDIIMPGVGGIELGRYILENRPSVPVIYTTSSRDFALEAYDNHALRYLLKPVRRDELFSALDMALSLGEVRQETLRIRSNTGNVVTVSPDEIVAVANEGRGARYILTDGRSVQTPSKRGTLDDIVEPLPERPEFIKPHHSFWVNMRYIREMQPTGLTLDNGMRVPISRNRLTEVRRAYLSFLEVRGGR